MNSFHSSSRTDVWIFSLEPKSSHSLSSYQKLLSTEEKLKAANFHFIKDQVRYTKSHGMKREILSKYLEIPPNEIIFERNKYGKPIVQYPSTPLFFNLSHSHESGTLAISHYPVGIDIEKLTPQVDYLSLAKHFLSPKELVSFQNVKTNENQLAFYRAWTQKEAYIKAIGLGFSYPINQVTISLGVHAQVLEDLANPSNRDKWNLFDFEINQCLGAVATQDEQLKIYQT